ncbi:LLM class flavin-dependent oxidoreductase [Actinomycetospora lutea]|uniref:LLM class flavin-dependent oxidoreductase n=1 Tax=Actinomycetospora lutea TaxID=663604 RepID=UPI002366FA92|nr:LLM class flavin-dependent oxidoreductase [Actinomycetospora lutea]MDD7941362.1 LLM class flavin-dependent oxidoreductase [Actinomycetospora lutea]
MTVLRGLGVTLPVDEGLSAGQYLDLARLAEDAGCTDVLVGEVAGPEVFAMLGMIAASTSRIRLGSGIVGVYPRTAVLTAMGFTTLASLAPGRVLAGLGASSPIIVEQWHGLAFDAPRARLEEYVAALRTVFRGERTDLDGPHVRSHGFRAGMAPVDVPILVAAMNPRMLRVAGAIADVAFLTWTPPEEYGPKIALVREGAEAAGRDPDEVGIAASFWAYAGDRVEEARERLRRFVLQYAMVPTHRPSFRGSFARLDEAADAWAGGDRRAALRAVDDDAVAAMCALGSGDDVAQRVSAMRAAGVDLPIALTPGAVPGDPEGPAATIERMATSAKEHA